MQLNHVGIINRSRDEAIRFYRDLLGFHVVKEVIVSRELSSQLFALSRDIMMVAFENHGVKIETFIIPEYQTLPQEIRHIGFIVDDLSALMKKARTAGIKVITGKTEDKTVNFIKDFSGNLIEIKQRQ